MGIPDRWEEYEALGSTVSGTRFISFKVPLKEVLCRDNRLPREKWFTPKELISQLQEKGLELGLVIDLTYTRRYYQPQELTDSGIEYVKIFTEGHAVPSADVRSKFFDAVEQFLEANKDNGRLIGVHCTHGLNRTGYLVCRYMIDRMNFEPNHAINAFNEARGYRMERENYLHDLQGKTDSESPDGKSVQQTASKRLHSDSRQSDRYLSKRSRPPRRPQTTHAHYQSNGFFDGPGYSNGWAHWPPPRCNGYGSYRPHHVDWPARTYPRMPMPQYCPDYSEFTDFF